MNKENCALKLVNEIILLYLVLRRVLCNNHLLNLPAGFAILRNASKSRIPDNIIINILS